MPPQPRKPARPQNGHRLNGRPAAPLIRLNPETRLGVLIVAIFALAFISALSLFGLAGDAGLLLRQGLRVLAGWAHWSLPLLLVWIGYSLLEPERFHNRPAHYLGLFLLLLSAAGLLHLRVPLAEALSGIPEGRGGGYLGFIIAYPLQRLTGEWASLVILLALGVVGLLIAGNTSLDRLALLHLLRRGKAWSKEQLLAAEQAGAERQRNQMETASEPTAEQHLPLANAVPSSRESGPATENRPTLPKSRPPAPRIDLPLDLLEVSNSQPNSGDIGQSGERIRRTLETFNIQVEMGEVNVGPTVTQYTLKPAEGVKLALITALQNDLALALAAHPIRIEAPIPGKSLVGIEVPNQRVAIVKLRELLESAKFRQRRSNLTIAVGKDVAGNAWMADLGAMPHLLIAGATGSGKSVCINDLIVTLLYQNSPDELKLILVDPKRVELTPYNDIPHLLTPVITDTEKTINALRWIVGEMERRYELLSVAGRRNIVAYNEGRAEDRLPYLVLIIDELADLMAVASNEVEGAIIRLAQMARSVGIHLVLATQRPSVDVITGLIKANITSRFAFAVASSVDSRTILDTAGAEKLLGKGDMLYISAELSKPKRLQCALVTDREIEQVTGRLRSASQPQYNETVVAKRSSGPRNAFGTGDIFTGSDSDPLLEEAKELVVKTGKASASLLQRRLRVGYARAARLLDLLEEEGVVGPGDGAKPREILVPVSPDAALIEEDSESLQAETVDGESGGVER